jgi:hypothetical protein
MDLCMTFFTHLNAPDEIYRILANSDWQPARSAREFIENTWPRVAPFLDDDFPQKAAREFNAHFWEMYLAVALLDAECDLVTREERGSNEEGPDFLLRTGVAIEAVAKKPGTGDDAVQQLIDGTAQSVPDDRIKLRILNAIDDKRRKLARYVEKGTHSAATPFVVAVNAASVPSARLEHDLPRIVRALFPFGHLQVRINPQSMEITSSSYQRQDGVAKASGTLIRTDTFLAPDGPVGISAVLSSCTDSVNRPNVAGGDFVVVDNPHARAPIALGTLPAREEYFLKDGAVGRTAGILTRLTSNERCN